MPNIKQLRPTNQLLEVLSPSWLSGLLAVFFGLLLTVGVIVAFTAHNSTIQQQLTNFQQKEEKPLTTPDQVLAENDKPTLKGSWPLLIVWSLAGVAAYLVATNIARSISDANDLRETLGYVHADRRLLLQSATTHIIAWGISIIMWIAFTVFFFKWAIPYAITAAHASVSELRSLNGLLYAVLAFSVIAIGIHLHAVFMRLVARRSRIFG